ncbi:MAG TPA: hypothetical protein VJN71_09470 [Nitrososphaerales archaeon]|nr:hypothetical protein [Nitrososphaerales archaeon]
MKSVLRPAAIVLGIFIVIIGIFSVLSSFFCTSTDSCTTLTGSGVTRTVYCTISDCAGIVNAAYFPLVALIIGFLLLAFGIMKTQPK